MAEQTFHESIIEEFRANRGVVTRPYPDSTLVLVTIRGARTGRQRTLPLEYFELDGVLHISATASGAPDNPAWYHNLVANPQVTVEYGTETFEAVARELPQDERDRAWRTLVGRKPRFAEYEQKTDRTIPVFALERV
jgi:deazaflavin-dependent oxidoreductase (nitroreductase family)